MKQITFVFACLVALLVQQSDGQNTTSSPEPEPELVVPNAIGRNGIVVQPIPEEPLAASEPESTVVYTLPDGTPLSVTTSKVLIPPTPRTVALPGNRPAHGLSTMLDTAVRNGSYICLHIKAPTRSEAACEFLSITLAP